MNNKLKSFFTMTLGTLLTTAGIYFFKLPNNFSTGGVSGISVILGAISENLSAGSFILIINATLLILGFLIIGRDFGFKTVYCCLLMSILVFALEKIVPITKPLTTQPVLELSFAILLPAAGAALLFDNDASTGGTDIVAMIIKKYTYANISKSLFIADVAIVMLCVFVFGIETWLYSMLAFIAKTVLMNYILQNINMSKYLTIIINPEHEQTVVDYITEALHKTATISESYHGAYNHDTKSVILTALNRKQTIQLKKFVKEIDEKSFVIINSTSDISGKGFKAAI